MGAMTRKRWLWCLVPLALLLAGAAGLILLPKPDPVQERFDRIRVGMSEKEVEEILKEEPQVGISFSMGFRDTDFWEVSDGRTILLVYGKPDNTVHQKHLVEQPSGEVWWRKLLQKAGISL